MTLVLRNLSKSFGTVKAVDDVSLTIEEGEVVAVIGRSGAGKSTLLRLINRLETADSGAMSWQGAPVLGLRGNALRQWRTSCAMIFQHYGLVDRLDVITNVLLGRLSSTGLLRSLTKSFSREDRARAILELDRLDLAAAALQRAGTLSGGQKQRVAIARAMMQTPGILLADEPVSALDRANTKAVMDALVQVNRERGTTILINLHDLALATSVCDRIIAMAEGRVVFDGPAEALTADKQATIFNLDMDAAEAA